MNGMSIAVLKKIFNYEGSMKKSNNGRKKNIAMEKAVLFFGGTMNLSKKLNANDSNVSKWLYETRLIPIKYAVQIEYLTKGKIKASDLRPDIFKQSIKEVKRND